MSNDQHEAAMELITAKGLALVDEATALGLVLTIEQVPLKPPAMGHYRTEVSVRKARQRAAQKEAS